MENKLTVKTEDGRILMYNPARTGAGVAVFEQRIQKFARGGHVQFTAPDKDLGVTNRNTGGTRILRLKREYRGCAERYGPGGPMEPQGQSAP